MVDKHPLDKLAEFVEVGAGDPSECPEAIVEDCVDKNKWEIDFDSWWDGGECIPVTLKKEYCPKIQLLPTDVYIQVDVAVTYYIEDAESIISMFFDFVEDDTEKEIVSPDHEFTQIIKQGVVREHEIMAVVNDKVKGFKNQLINGLNK